MTSAITSALSTIITCVGSVVSELTASDGELAALLPVFAIGIGCSVLCFSVKVLKSFTWGA